MNTPPRDKLILLIGLITYGIGQSLLYVIFGPVARDIGLSETQFGILIAASNMALVFSAPRWGRASQSMGRKPVFVIGLIGYALGYVLLAFGLQAGLWGLLSPLPLFFLLLAARLFYGIICGGIQPAATAYIADTTDAANRSKAMALLAASGGIGTIIGPAFGGGLASFGVVVPMYVASAMAIFAAAWAWFKLAEPERHVSLTGDVRLSFMDARVFPYLFGWFVVFGVFTAVQVITPFYLEDHFGLETQQQVIRAAMIALLSMALVTLVMQIIVMQILKLSPRTLLRISFFIVAASLGILAIADSTITLYVSFAVMGLAFALAVPGLNAAATLSVEREEQGAVAGLLGAAPTLGMVVGPILGGLTYNLSPTAPIIASAVLALVLGIYFQFVRVPDPAAPLIPASR